MTRPANPSFQENGLTATYCVNPPCQKDLPCPMKWYSAKRRAQTLLPAETERCTVTGKRADRRLLSQSEATGDFALKKCFVRCEKTRKRVLPRELVACDLTGANVLPGELELCAVTGLRVLRDRLLRGAASNRFVLPEKAVRSLLTGAVGVPDEIAFCAWLGGPILTAESGVCRLTGCTVAQKFLNKAGELAPLRRLLDGSAPEALKDMAAARWLANELPKEFSRIRTLWYLLSPNGDVAAVCAEVGSFLGLPYSEPQYVIPGYSFG